MCRICSTSARCRLWIVPVVPLRWKKLAYRDGRPWFATSKSASSRSASQFRSTWIDRRGGGRKVKARVWWGGEGTAVGDRVWEEEVFFPGKVPPPRGPA